MYFTSENQTLYPSTIHYNLALIMTELARIAANHGAVVRPEKNGYIVNRSIMENIDEKKQRIEKLEAILKNGSADSIFTGKVEIDEKRKAAINNALAEYRAEIERLEAIDNSPVKVSNTSWVHFVLDGVFYDYSLPDNCFDDFRFYKTPVIGGKVDKWCYPVDDPKEWYYDCFFSPECSKADIVEAANLIFNLMVNAPMSKPYRETYRRRVANRYNDGYHYETIEKPTHLEALSWLTGEQ